MTTDSRKISLDSGLFVYRRKQRWSFLCSPGNGHGAAGLIASAERLPPELQQAPRIEVASPNRALLDWAADYRKRYSSHVLGITGKAWKHQSPGIFAKAWILHATRGNYNNFIGVPLTLLSAPLDTSWWVVKWEQTALEDQTCQGISADSWFTDNIGKAIWNFYSTQLELPEKSGLWKDLWKVAKPGFQQMCWREIFLNERPNRLG